MKKNVLVIGPYLPGKSYGGPVKSLLNIVDTLSDQFNFYIITGDRDLNSSEVYSNVKIGSWNQVDKAKVFYIPKGNDFKYIKLILRQINYDLVYTNSFFSKHSIIIQFLKYFNFIKKPILVAPRGEFSTGALAIKTTKKKLFLSLYKALNLKRNISYTCTSSTEKQDFLNVLGNDTNVQIAANIVNRHNKPISKRQKQSGQLKIATLSRISKIKNIDYSLSLLKVIDNNNNSFSEIVFDIYGPLEDKNYWNECLLIIGNLSEKIIVNYKGAIEYSEVTKILSNYHIFLFPTKGENFGHVIQESFLSGCPVITSDQTPWRELEKINVGFDIALKDQIQFIEAIKYYLYMDEETYSLTSVKAFKYGISKVENQLSIIEHLDMFNALMEGGDI